MKPTLHILTGPTAVGKTEWALRWAEKHNAEVVSCDSLLFYRGMDIGTAKPTAAERARVPHHLIDICAITERMDVAAYVPRAKGAIEDIIRRGRAVLVTGGSGFYLKSYFAAVTDNIDVSADIRGEVGSLSAEQALARLKALNPQGLEGLDEANPRRVARALERCLASGRTLREVAEDFARLPSPFADFEISLTILQRDAPELQTRMAARVEAMLRDGLVDEVRRLRSAGLEENPSAAKAIGYREVLKMLDGALPESQLAAEIVKNTRGLVKKQQTWFRTQLPAHRTIRASALGPGDETALFGPADQLL